MDPNENKPSSTPQESPVEDTAPIESTTPLEPSSPELTAQVDDLMATSAAETTGPEAPLASTIITPTVSTPTAFETESTVPETAPETVTPEETTPLTSPAEAVIASAPEFAAEPTPIVEPSTAEPVAANAPAKPKRSWLKVVFLVLAVFLGLAAITAAVYAEVIIPNRPDVVLMKSLENSLQQSQVSYKGSVDLNSGGTASKIVIAGAQDNSRQASDVNLTATSSGITLPLEARLVDKNVYLKVGDLTPVVSLLGMYGDATTTKELNSVSQQLSNKWVSIDSTLLKQAGVSCFTDTKFALTQADVKLLEDQYKTNPFATIQNTSNDTVNGQKVVKYQLSIDDDKAATYGSKLGNLSLTKSLNSCNKKTQSSSIDKNLRDHDKRPLTVWVNKGSKQIVQIASQSTSRDANKGVKGSGTISFSYNPVSITAPADSVPVLELIASIQKTLGVPTTSSSDLSGLLTGLVGGPGVQTKADDTRLQTNLLAVDTQVEAYNATNGSYPTLAEVNSASWRATNMKGMDPTALEGIPGGPQMLAAAPGKGSIAYQPTTATGTPCSTSGKCTGFTLTAILSDGTPYTKTALN